MVVSVSIVLGIMVLVHEWGHFIVAKSFGVRVEIFSIGFGTRLWGIKRGDTDYRVSALPLGGYVKMAGDNPLEERKGDPDEFLSKPRWQRVLIALAGPAMNIVLSIVLVAGIYMRGSKQPAFLDRPMVLVGVLQDSAAQKAGLMPGDHIVSVNGTSNPTWDRAQLELMSTLPGHTISSVVDRNGQQIPSSVPAAPSVEEVFGYPQDHLVVGAVSPGNSRGAKRLEGGRRNSEGQWNALNNGAEFPPIVDKSQSAAHSIWKFSAATARCTSQIRPQQVSIGQRRAAMADRRPAHGRPGRPAPLDRRRDRRVRRNERPHGPANRLRRNRTVSRQRFAEAAGRARWASPGNPAGPRARGRRNCFP